jgi:gp106|nr:MAG TPA: RNA-dependent RNA polymerase [Caudoviricetes sp.]
MNLEEAYLEHQGTPHQGSIPHSGRYKWGSGENSYQRATSWSDTVAKYRKTGLTDTQIATKLGITTSEFRARNTIANQTIRLKNQSMIMELHEKGLGPTEISRRTGIPESSVRMNLNEQVRHNVNRMESVKNDLKALIKENQYLDVGLGSAQQLGIKENTLKRAVQQLEAEGYHMHKVYVKNATNDDHWVEMKVLTKESNPDIVREHKHEIVPPNLYKTEDGTTKLGLRPIEHIDWKRVNIRYDEQGGTDKDGVMELRPGVKDLDLGGSRYAQVRIGVGGTHYLKGMAVYGDPKDFPKGVDVIFNTNKKQGTPKESVLKKLKDDPDNPFGAQIKANGQKGAINKVNEEGDWGTWSKTLSSQFVSKQPPALVKGRIQTTYDNLQKEFNEINSLTNPVIKKALMQDFADGLTTKRHNLKLTGFDRMKGQVILPLSGIKANEIYAPNFKNGEKVVLVRYPHGGIFELPELTVNNKLEKGPAKFMKGAKDAVGIDSSVASKLSGADFDGDTVMVIPNNKNGIKTSRSLKELKNFDTNKYYSTDPKVLKRDSKGNWPEKQRKMGEVSNLITDMTLKGASQSEIARAVKHSMVVIDAEKHNLDYKRSERENDIPSLKKKYQEHYDVISGKIKNGASTLISRSKTEHRTLEYWEKARTPEELAANPKLKPTIKKSKTISTDHVVEMVKDAKTLGSGTPIENMYGDYINALGKMRTKANKVVETTPNMTMSKEAKLQYKSQVESLQNKLNLALSNSPRERQAQLIANKVIAEKRDPNMQKDQLKKLKQQAIAAARVRTGADGASSRITIEPDEWKAIQSGAVSTKMLTDIIRFSDSDRLKQLATPKKEDTISLSTANRAKGMLKNGRTYAEVAEALGVSVSTVQNLV